MKNPSPFQSAIFDFASNGSGNAIVKAVAGSGKTTTIVETVKLIQGSSIFLAFNKAIAEELKARGVNARTFHSLCYRPVLDVVGAKSVNDQKVSQLIRAKLSENDAKIYGSFVRKLVGLARQSGLGALSDASGEAFYALVEHHDITLETEGASEAQGIEYAREILTLSNKMKEVDFDDLLYFSVLHGVRLPEFDWVLVDEAQDTNQIQRAILRKILAKRGRLIAVGDPAQAIYGFRGADSDALELIAEDFQPCTWLPLSVTYRCATSITAMAQTHVPDIQAAPGAPEGEVLDRGDTGWALTDLGPKDLVICRNTKPLLDLGFRLMRAKIPLRILGREIGEGLIALIRKCDTARGNIERFQKRLEDWRDRETEKAVAKGLEAKADAVQDKAGTLLMLLDDLPENKRTTDELISIIQALFTDQNSRITLSTIHKAKGMEANTVWWLAPSLCPSKWARKDWQIGQEHNLMYVAITRAKTRLNMIELPKKGGGK